MNKKFILVDKINNIQKEATYILFFQNNNEKYLIYYLDENNSNKQVFVSKLITNTEGKNYIIDINPNDKNRINNIVYNIVIVYPTEGNKNNNYNKLIEELKNKFNIDLSIDPVNLDNQDYLINSRVAITSEVLVNNCINFYNNNLRSNQFKLNNNSTNIPVENSLQEVNNIVQNDPVIVAKTINNDVIPNLNVNNQQAEDFIDNNQLPNINPQMQILSNVNNNDSIRTVLNNDNNNIVDNKSNKEKNNKGFIINASIIIGTVAILLAVLIVTFTFITIKKMII